VLGDPAHPALAVGATLRDGRHQLRVPVAGGAGEGAALLVGDPEGDQRRPEERGGGLGHLAQHLVETEGSRHRAVDLVQPLQAVDVLARLGVEARVLERDRRQRGQRREPLDLAGRRHVRLPPVGRQAAVGRLLGPDRTGAPPGSLPSPQRPSASSGSSSPRSGLHRDASTTERPEVPSPRRVEPQTKSAESPAPRA
jgi:hypothetical protein